MCVGGGGGGMKGCRGNREAHGFAAVCSAERKMVNKCERSGRGVSRGCFGDTLPLSSQPIRFMSHGGWC